MTDTDKTVSRYFTAFLIGGAAGVTSAFLTGIVLAFINIYLTGHDIRWQEQNFTLGFISLSFLDGLLLTIAWSVFFLTFSQSLEESAHGT